MNTLEFLGLERCDACGLFCPARFGHLTKGIDIDVSGGYGAAIDTHAGPITLALCSSCAAPVLALVARSKSV